MMIILQQLETDYVRRDPTVTNHTHQHTQATLQFKCVVPAVRVVYGMALLGATASLQRSNAQPRRRVYLPSLLSRVFGAIAPQADVIPKGACAPQPLEDFQPPLLARAHQK